MNHIKLPTLYCPFPSGINPHFDKTVNQHTLDWVRSFNLVTDESVYQSWRVQQIPTFAARFYPNASLKALEILCDTFSGFIPLMTNPRRLELASN